MIESGRVPGKGRICGSIEKLSERVLGKGRICGSIQKLPGRVPENGRINVNTGKWLNPGEYREKVESMPLLKNSPEEFRKRVESL